jgi:DsbC/DsbD-like thiol-disulfide interchange protein
MLALLLPCLVLIATPALAASSEWHPVEGGAIRIVTAEAPEGGMLRGALEIRLEPGWKTYWVDPGEFGVPPQIELAGRPEPARIRFPAPVRIDDGYSAWAGYDRSTRLALELPPVAPHGIRASVFLGICKSICIPVQADLAVASQPLSNPEEARIVDEAFASLPRQAGSEFGIVRLHRDGDRLLAQLSLPRPGADAELFLVEGGGWRFGLPSRLPGDMLAIPVRARPAGSAPIAYTLVSGDAAVEGRIAVSGEEE